MLDHYVAFERQKTGHDDDSALASGFAQHDAFVDIGHGEPAGALGFEHMRDGDGSMTIGISLDHRHDFHAGSCDAADLPEIVGYLCPRDLHPGSVGGPLI